jgi:predicted dehydrogenase
MTRRRTVIAGAGQWARNWAKVLAACSDVEIVGWVDIVEGLAADAAEQRGLTSIFTGTNVSDAIAAAQPDLVMVLTSPSTHHEVAIEALGRGVPVLCEKPMADSMEHAQDMVAASERVGCLLAISQQRRYNTHVETIRKLIAEHIGSPSILNSDFYIAHPQAPFLTGAPSPLLLDMAIHTFDVARYMSSSDPVSVWCDDFSTPWSWFNGNDSATAHFEMTGGLRYTYRGSWTSGAFNTAWEAEWRAIGPAGTIVWDGETRPKAEVIEHAGTARAEKRRVSVDVEENVYTGLDASIRDFLRALDTGEPPRGECHDNIKSLSMVFGAIESASTGRRITIDPAEWSSPSER